MKLKPLLPTWVIPIALGSVELAGIRHEADGVEGRDVRVLGQRDGDPALAESLLDSLKNCVVKALDLLGCGLTTEEARQLAAVVPGLSTARGDGSRQWVRAVADVDKRLDGREAAAGADEMADSARRGYGELIAGERGARDNRRRRVRKRLCARRLRRHG